MAARSPFNPPAPTARTQTSTSCSPTARTCVSSPSFAAFEGGQNLGTTVPAPEDWIAANNGEFPASCQGVNPTTNTDANDSVMLSLRIRVPTNARSFTTRMFFFTAEHPEWVCSQYNDFFVALIDSATATNPADKNIAVYDDGQDLWPVGLNILTTAPGLFGVCESGNVGCQGDLPQVPYACPAGPAALAGTGFDAIDSSESCNGAGFPVGGGTGWLVMSGNVEPGEIIAIGPGKYEDGKLVPMSVKVGDKVLYGKYSGTEVTIDNENYLILRESDVLAVIN